MAKKVPEKYTKLKEKEGKYYCTDFNKGKIIRIISKIEIPDSEVDRHLEKRKKK